MKLKRRLIPASSFIICNWITFCLKGWRWLDVYSHCSRNLKNYKKRSFSNVLVFVLLYSPTLILQPRPLFFNLDPNSSTATLILQPNPYSSTSTLILLPRPLFFNPNPYSLTPALSLQPRPLFFNPGP